MRLNLNCRKAEITKIDVGKYRLVFDISKIKKPRLATTARLYIEHLNLPEFIDDAWGPLNGSNRGHLELYCENLDEENMDEEGYGNQTLIYSSPLISFHSFTNSDPMKISNFGVRGDFLRDKLVMTLCIYDQYGEPYDKATNLSTEIDKTSAEYSTYITKLAAWQTKYNTLETKVSAKEARIETFRTEYEVLKEASDDLEAELEKAYDDLIVILDTKIATTTSALNKAKFSEFKSQLQKCGYGKDKWDEISFLLTHIAQYPAGIAPFDQSGLQPLLKQFGDTFYAYTKAYLIAEAKNNDITAYNTALGKVIIDPNIILSNTNLLDVKRVINESHAFTLASPAVVGKVILNMFMSKNGYEIRAVLNDIQGATSSLVVGNQFAVSTVNPVFKFYHPEEFRWIIAKNTNAHNGTDVLTRASTGTRTNIGTVRYGFAVIREKDNDDWKVEELGIDNTDFNVNDTLVFKGENFGGNSANDLTITITDIHQPQDITYPQVPMIMPNVDTGTLLMTLTKNKTTNDYTLNSQINNTKNLNIGDKLKIDGETLGGQSGTHDLVQEVVAITKASREQSFDISRLIPNPTAPTTNIDNANFDHRIGTFQITDDAVFANKVLVSDYAGNAKTDRTDYKISISSLNGKYTFNVVEPGNNFELHDIISIDGQVFYGKSGNNPATATDSAENDFALIITTVGIAGQIVALEAYDYNAPKTSSYVKTVSDPGELYYARCPDNFKLKVETKIGDNNYYIDTTQFEYDAIDQVKKGDTFTIKGSLMQDFNKTPNTSFPYDHPPATDTTNDLIFRIVELNPDEARRQSLASTVPGADESSLAREANNSLITIAITPNKAPIEAGPVGKLKLVKTLQKAAAPQEDVGRIKAFTFTGTSKITDIDKIQYATGTDQSALFPTIAIELTEIPVSSIQANKTAVATAHTEMMDAKKLVQNTNSTSVSVINETKLKNLNMSLVLYDEIPEYTQASKDAIVGNTYSRLVNNQFKRI